MMVISSMSLSGVRTRLAGCFSLGDLFLNMLELMRSGPADRADSRGGGGGVGVGASPEQFLG
jgi:hypothetical protein